MADNSPSSMPMEDTPANAALQRTHWRMRRLLSSFGDMIEAFLANAGFDLGPWLAVSFAGGIALWFLLSGPAQWITALVLAIIAPVMAFIFWARRDERVHIFMAVLSIALAVAGGIMIVWARSEIVGAEPLARPIVALLDAKVLERIEQPADRRIRLILASRNPVGGSEAPAEAIKLRVNLPIERDRPGLSEGAIIRLRARLMPPAPPMLPGSYNFARTAWFAGFAATGSVLGEVEVLNPARAAGGLKDLQRSLSSHVRSRLNGSSGTIAATLASGDRGAINRADEEAMRDSGLTHLLSISGLHVSALIAGAYLLAIKLLALWPWLALRVRLPLVAAGLSALVGIGYTLLTGAEVPTIRSCVGAVLVLIALALGREALSLRMIAVAAGFVLLVWPESLVGPSFQLSFSAVIAIVALHGSAPVRKFLGQRDEGAIAWTARHGTMLLLTGFVIEIALMPIVFHHFHRGGIYGAFANVIAIPLVTFVSMPLIALALSLDLVGLGAPAWWMVGKSLDLLLGIAHWTADRPGAVKLMPQMGGLTFGLFVTGGLWLGLWRGKARLLGLIPAGFATVMLLATPRPDMLISGDGRHAAITTDDGRLLLLRDTTSDYVRDNLTELAGLDAETVPLDEWPDARCSADFCSVSFMRGGRNWAVLLARSNMLVSERALAAACERADIVVADRRLPHSCTPRWIKADRRMLEMTGGLSIDLADQQINSVAEAQGQHGWWKVSTPR